MALLGWVPWRDIPTPSQPRFVHNASGRFESRFCMVKIVPSNSILLRGMAGSVLGVWVAHGEGRLHCPDPSLLSSITDQSLAPVRYVDYSDNITTCYPYNPSGTPDGIAALCSPNGRHLAIMPHPERSFLQWQCPYIPPRSLPQGSQVSPWLQLFQNARLFCDSSSSSL